MSLDPGLLARDGLLSNFWGLGCPIHCRESSLSSWLLAFLLGFILATSCFALWLSFLPVYVFCLGGDPPMSSRVCAVVRPERPADSLSGQFFTQVRRLP